MKKKTKMPIWNKILLIIFIGIILFNSYTLLCWKLDEINNKKEKEEIENIINIDEIEDTENTEIVNAPQEELSDYWEYIKLPLINVNIRELQEVNADTIGFISVGGTNINYPVVQSDNNEYYLNHSFKKEKNEAGWIFMDYRNNYNLTDKNTVIYGHNRIDRTMFGTLSNILKTNWLDNKNNFVIKMSTLEENTLWQVFSVYSAQSENYYIRTNFENNEQYQDWLQEMLKRSEYNFNTSVNEKDNVLTLSTCYGNNKRVVMQAKLIKKESK